MFNEVMTKVLVFSDGTKVGVERSCTLHQGRNSKECQYFYLMGVYETCP